MFNSLHSICFFSVPPPARSSSLNLHQRCLHTHKTSSPTKILTPKIHKLVFYTYFCFKRKLCLRFLRIETSNGWIKNVKFATKPTPSCPQSTRFLYDSAGDFKKEWIFNLDLVTCYFSKTKDWKHLTFKVIFSFIHLSKNEL